MEVITMESKVFKEIAEKISAIAEFVFTRKQPLVEENLDDMWVDNYDVCAYLKISQRTLQRLRSKGLISYSIISGKSYYTIGEVKRLLNNKLIKSTDANLNDLINSYQLNSRRSATK